MEKLSTILTNRLKNIREYSVGLSADDVRRLKPTVDLADDILKCLASSDIVDQQMALFFLESLNLRDHLDKDRQLQLVTKLVDLSSETGKQTQAPCHRLLVQYRAQIPNYRAIMLKGLHNPDPMVRKEAILAYDSFCQVNEVEPLEIFEKDNYATETSMGSPLVYELRNMALEKIEHVIGKSFKKSEKAYALENGEIGFCWDWTPYHSWKNSWFKKIFLHWPK